MVGQHQPLSERQKQCLIHALGLGSFSWFVEEFFLDQKLRRVNFSGCHPVTNSTSPSDGVRIRYQKGMPRKDMKNPSLISLLFPYPFSLLEMAFFGARSSVAVELVGDLHFLRGLFDGVHGLGERMGPSVTYVVEWGAEAERVAVLLQTDRRRRVSVSIPPGLSSVLRKYHSCQGDSSVLSQTLGAGCRYALVQWKPRNSAGAEVSAENHFYFNTSHLAVDPASPQIKLFSSESPGNSPR